MQDAPLSILYFSNCSVRGGAEEHILTLMRGLDRSRFRIHLVCPPVLTDLLSADLPPDVAVHSLSFKKPTDFAAARNLARIIKQSQADIVHSHLFYSSLFASPIAWLCRVPVVVETPHVSERWRHGWKSHFVVDRAAGRFVNYYIAVSYANARYLIEQKGLPPKKIVVIQNGCDLKRFDPQRAAPAGLRESLGFAPNDPVLMVAGRLEPQKGHRVLLEAMPEIRREFPRVRLVCVGEGGLRRDLETQAASLGLNGSARFVGYQSNVADWLALADITVLPSFYEGLPLVAIESLAAGRPVVATNVDGTPEVVINEKTGLTVPPGDAPQLAAALCRLLRDTALRQRLGENGATWVRKHFDQDQQVQKTQGLYLEAYEGACERRKRGWRIEDRGLTHRRDTEDAEEGQEKDCRSRMED